MRVLITGATGFIGQQFIAAQHEYYEVNALVRSRDVSIPGAITHHYDGTINSIKYALKEIDIVLHLATFYRATHQEEDITPLLEANIVFGTQLLEAMKKTGKNRIVNVGTTWQKFNDEHYKYANLYAATKQAFQELLAFYSDAYSWNCLNLHFNDTYGKTDQRKKIIQLLIETAKNGTSLDMSPGEQRFETCHICDAVRALDIALKRVSLAEAPKSEEFTILTGDDISLKELTKLIESEFNLPININWGGRPYRDREVMTLPESVYQTLPGWKKQVSLKEGIKELWCSESF
ncbi:NAD(P)-dependent oxidoreductase [Vibrio genomosp. F6]|uniref:NAD-dependent epimerase/dehydratase family protein n=1 Tax=Vibrio genomosp. F6 TaxID=723172 RepID=UPI0010BCF758|nr:NAD(P)-dependent oxidoreductase [Vibrio genomosp. F6]TKF23451.1 NAD(P)-dependent oxidoreductase [Vibrio genomosp. F6]